MYMHARKKLLCIYDESRIIAGSTLRYAGRKKNCANRGTENFRKIVVGDVERIKKGRG